MKGNTLEMTMLFDFYGEILTDKQRDFFDLYHNEDLSLSEIAENSGISRQGVRDVICRAEGALREMEARMGLIARRERESSGISRIIAAARSITAINNSYYSNLEIASLASEIEKICEELGK